MALATKKPEPRPKSRPAAGAEGGEAPAASSSVPEEKTRHGSKILTNKLLIPAAEGGSTARKNPVYDTPKLRAFSDSVEPGKSLGEQYAASSIPPPGYPQAPKT